MSHACRTRDKVIQIKQAHGLVLIAHGDLSSGQVHGEQLFLGSHCVLLLVLIGPGGKIAHNHLAELTRSPRKTSGIPMCCTSDFKGHKNLGKIVPPTLKHTNYVPRTDSGNHNTPYENKQDPHWDGDCAAPLEWPLSPPSLLRN